MLTIEQLSANEDVYDITVEGNHNFFADGILVHNCAEISLNACQFCVSGDTNLVTLEGKTSIKDAVGTQISIWNGDQWCEVTPFKTGDSDTLHRVFFSDGSYLDATDNHKFLVKHRFQKEYKEVETLDLIEMLRTSKYALSVPRANFKYDGGVNEHNAYDYGFVLGDGCATKSSVGAGLFGKDKQLNFNTAKVVGNYTNYNGTPFTQVEFDLDVSFSKELKYHEGLPKVCFTWNKDSILKFIAGWADADGTNASNGIRIYGSEDKIRDVQLLLTKIGIDSSINLMQKKGTLTNLGVRKNSVWYVQITKTFEIPCQRLKCDNETGSKFKGKDQVIKRIDTLEGKHESYCLNEPILHQCVFNNVLTKQCNLTEMNVSDVVDQDDLNGRARAAAFIGTLQAGYTNFHYLRDQWKETTEREALIGVGQTGIASAAVLNLDLEQAAKVVLEENSRVAKLIGINQAARTTTVKPSGCVTLDTEIKTTMGCGISMGEIFAKNGYTEEFLQSCSSNTWLEIRPEVGDMLTVMDENNDPQAITKLYVNGLQDVFEIEFEDGNSYKFTGNHRLKTANGWKRVDELKESDEIVSF